MVIVLHAEDLGGVIYANDRTPAHVYVFGDGEAKIDLADSEGTPILLWTRRHVA